jgi:hypothetical protein
LPSSRTGCARLGDRFAGLWLYGSQARGAAGPESDIDLIVLLRGMERPGQEIDRIVDLLAELNFEYQVFPCCRWSTPSWSSHRVRFGATCAGRAGQHDRGRRSVAQGTA